MARFHLFFLLLRNVGEKLSFSLSLSVFFSVSWQWVTVEVTKNFPMQTRPRRACSFRLDASQRIFFYCWATDNFSAICYETKFFVLLIFLLFFAIEWKFIWLSKFNSIDPDLGFPHHLQGIPASQATHLGTADWRVLNNRPFPPSQYFHHHSHFATHNMLAAIDRMGERPFTDGSKCRWSLFRKWSNIPRNRIYFSFFPFCF